MEEKEKRKPTTIYLRSVSPPTSPNEPHQMDRSKRRKVAEAASVSGAVVVGLRVRSLEEGVDLGFIRGAVEGEWAPDVGQEYSRKVRLNGHFIGSASSGVSSLTWSSLISFFSSRGHPNGLRPTSPILVTSQQTASVSKHGDQHAIENTCQDFRPCSKRISDTDLETEQSRSTKKPMFGRYEMQSRDDSKEVHDGNGVDAAEAARMVDHSVIWMKRKLNLDDNAGNEEVHLMKRITTEQGRYNSPASCSEAFRLFSFLAASSTGN